MNNCTLCGQPFISYSYPAKVCDACHIRARVAELEAELASLRQRLAEAEAIVEAAEKWDRARSDYYDALAVNDRCKLAASCSKWMEKLTSLLAARREREGGGGK